MRACMRAWLHLLNRTLFPTPPPTPIPTHSPRQMDLADMGAHANLGGFRYLLIVFDLHTKFMWICVLKKKEAKPIAAKVRRNACSCRCPPLPNSVQRLAQPGDLLAAAPAAALARLGFEVDKDEPWGRSSGLPRVTLAAAAAAQHMGGPSARCTCRTGGCKTGRCTCLAAGVLCGRHCNCCSNGPTCANYN